MESISEKYTGGDYSMHIKCPECDKEDVIINVEQGYFYVCECNKCGYKEK